MTQVKERVLEWTSPQYPTLLEQPPPQYEDAEIIADTVAPTKALVAADTWQKAPTARLNDTADNRHRQAIIVGDKVRTVGEWIVGATVIVALVGGFVWVVGIVLEVVAATVSVAVSVLKDVAMIVGIGVGIVAVLKVVWSLLQSGDSTPYRQSPPKRTEQNNNTGQTINININGSGSQSFNKF